MSQGLTVVLMGLLACQMLFLQINVGAVSNRLAALYSKLRSANSRTEFCAIYETYARQSWEEPHRTGLDLLLSNQPSAPRLPYYLYLEEKVEAPIFQQGILSYKGPGDNEDLWQAAVRMRRAPRIAGALYLGGAYDLSPSIKTQSRTCRTHRSMPEQHAAPSRTPALSASCT